MTAPLVKLAAAPCLSFSQPTCGVCHVEVESDGDGYECPTCRTSWAYDDGEDRPGTLYEDWSGETLDIPVSDPDDVWRITLDAERTAARAAGFRNESESAREAGE